MKDWSDIIGEELKDIEEPLPADDWSVLQQKYASSRRSRKIVLLAWAGGITSVAAAVALVLMLVRHDMSPVNDSLVADELSPIVETMPADTSVTDVVPVDSATPAATPKQQRIHVVNLKDDSLVAEENSAVEVIEVVKDTVSVTEKLLADADNGSDSASGHDSESDPKADPDKKTDKEQYKKDDSSSGYYGFGDFPEEVKRKRIPMSVGMSGSVSAVPLPFAAMMDMEPMLPAPTDPLEPKDSTVIEGSEPSPAYAKMRSKSAYKESYSHEIPKSIGVSARFFMTERLSVNTGLNYTIFNSTRHRVYTDGSDCTDRQQVHYLGIPVRLDYMAVNRKYFSFYLGAGGQMDKCLYGRVGDERLHEKLLLFSVTGAAGIQVNFSHLVGLYFEPDVSYSLNKGTLKTYRDKNDVLISLRAGLRFSF